jgi:hypothetical protein
VPTRAIYALVCARLLLVLSFSLILSAFEETRFYTMFPYFFIFLPQSKTRKPRISSRTPFRAPGVLQRTMSSGSHLIFVLIVTLAIAPVSTSADADYDASHSTSSSLYFAAIDSNDVTAVIKRCRRESHDAMFEAEDARDSGDDFFCNRILFQPQLACRVAAASTACR